MSEKSVIFGAGFLGKRISKELQIPCISRKELDVTNINDLEKFLDKEKPEVVINAAGKTGGKGAIGIDWCEGNKEETIKSNTLAPAIISTECSKRKIYFVHLGSGCIYDGDNDGKGFCEKDEPNFYGPQFYAISKIESERILRNFPGLILRIRMPIDDRPHERNLIDKLKSYSKVIDAQNSMTTIPHMIHAIKKLIEKRAEGVYNLVNPETISAAEIMKMYKKIVNPKHEFKILSIAGLDKITIGKRSNCYLNTDKLKSEGIELPKIHDALRECLEEYRSYQK